MINCRGNIPLSHGWYGFLGETVRRPARSFWIPDLAPVLRTEATCESGVLRGFPGGCPALVGWRRGWVLLSFKSSFLHLKVSK